MNRFVPLLHSLSVPVRYSHRFPARVACAKERFTATRVLSRRCVGVCGMFVGILAAIVMQSDAAEDGFSSFAMAMARQEDLPLWQVELPVRPSPPTGTPEPFFTLEERALIRERNARACARERNNTAGADGNDLIFNLSMTEDDSAKDTPMCAECDPHEASADTGAD